MPFFESLFPRRVLGSGSPGKPPVRMGIFTVTGGTVLESWKPAETGQLKTLPSILRPLESAKDQITVVSGLAKRETLGQVMIRAFRPIHARRLREELPRAA